MTASKEIFAQAIKIIDPDADPARHALANGLLALSLEIEAMRQAQKANTDNLAGIAAAVSLIQSKVG